MTTISQKIPYISFHQSATCVPPTESLSMSIDMKILPESDTESRPFWGIWLLDISGSMRGERIEKAKESLIEQIYKLPDETGFNLVVFESTVKVIIKNETITQKTRPKIVEFINKIEASGGTALYTALKHGIKMLRQYSGHLPKKIILITDGEPGDVRVTLGNENDPNYEEYFLLAQEALEYKGSIDTVGALGEHNVYLLYEIAKKSTGKYIYAENPAELKTKMQIASHQTTRIIYNQPTITLIPRLGGISVEDAVQYKPTIIQMPFEKIRGAIKKYNYKAWLRSFEAGDTYQFIIKMKFTLDKSKITMNQNTHLLDIEFELGSRKLKTTKSLHVKFSEDPGDHRINLQINKHYAQLFNTAKDISEQTLKNDASATQRIQGDETKKVS